ncbi:MAG TPA: DNA gyrase inhibitor YacG [Polyangia bacterium]
MKAVRCPTCKKDVAPDAKSFPFCSERCRLVDLGNWLDGRYRIASQNDERKPDDPDAGPEDDEPERRH